MRRVIAALGLLTIAAAAFAAPPVSQTRWKQKLAAELPLLGHRNWILVVDSAYPLQSSPGVETIDTNARMTDVLPYVLKTIDNSIHVRPDIYMDAELPFVPNQDAPGASQYREEIGKILRGYPIQSVLHDKIIGDIGRTGIQFHVLVLKTNLTIPYTSVFIQLNCKYWSNDAEKRMREKMSAAGRSSDH
jgi:hypothetical protein